MHTASLWHMPLLHATCSRDGWQLCTASNCCTTVHQRLSTCLCASYVGNDTRSLSLLLGPPPHNTAAQPLSLATHSASPPPPQQPGYSQLRPIREPHVLRHTHALPKRCCNNVSHTLPVLPCASVIEALPSTQPQTDKAYRQTERHAVSHKFLHCVVGHLSPNCKPSTLLRCPVCVVFMGATPREDHAAAWCSPVSQSVLSGQGLQTSPAAAASIGPSPLDGTLLQADKHRDTQQSMWRRGEHVSVSAGPGAPCERRARHNTL